MESYLERHLTLLNNSKNFVDSWNLLGPVLQSLYKRAMRNMDRLTCSTDCLLLAKQHVRASEVLQAKLGVLPDREFDLWPDADRWICETLDVDHIERTFLKAGSALQDFLRDAEFPYVARWRSIKRDRSLAQKIHVHKGHGDPIDLWDAIRFRFSFGTPDDLARVSRQLLQRFDGAVIRFRNYYRRPRAGHRDPYRGVHCVLSLRETSSFCGYFEVQLLTVNRDAVGLIDHALIHKPELDFFDEGHRRWLAAMRMAANIQDACV